MAQPSIKTSFASGEWAPKLRSRVDIQKYHSGAALLRNWYVDYSGGGASTRQGTKFVNQAKISSSRVRLIGFQPSTTVSYVLEFGDRYVRFYTNGAPVVETATSITNAASGPPEVFTDAAHGYANGDWLFIGGSYYIVQNATTNTFTLTDLYGNALNTNPFALPINAQRVYTLTTPYAATDLFPNQAAGNPGLKWVQDVTSLIICHPSYAPQILTIASATNWSITQINFGATINTPTGLVLSTTLSPAVNSWHYGYLVTAVDVNGQESAIPSPAFLDNFQELQTTNGTNTLTWTAVTAAVSYNIYKASPTFNTAIAAGAQYGFVKNQTGITYTDVTPGDAPDFSQTPPIVQNPFQGASVASYTVTAAGSYAGATVPAVTIGGAPPGGTTATAYASVGAISVSGFNTFNGSFSVGQLLTFDGTTIQVTSLDGSNHPNAAVVVTPGSFTSGTVPATSQEFAQTANPANNLLCNVVWGVTSVIGVNNGAGYLSAPAVTFSAGAATATSTLAAASAGNPGVPGFLQERLVLAAQPHLIQGFQMSQPGSFFNYNISQPTEDDDAISGNIISEELNDIRSLTPVATGIVAFTGKGAWLLNGGGGISTLNPITPANATANPQAFNGANDLRPLKINLDALYVTNKGNYVRDLAFNIYANIYTGSDVSVLSNHLFFGFSQVDWCWAEEPFKTMWSVRNDGTMLSLGFVKEQELIGWAHHDTNGQFMSVCSVIETVNGNVVDAVYCVVQRFVNGQLLQYVERMADRYFPYGYEDSWSVDCALQTVPQVSPTSTLTITGDASAAGNVVTLTDTSSVPFTAPMAAGSWVVRAGGGIYKITAFTSSSQVTATVVQVPSVINLYSSSAFPVTGYTIWEPITTVTGLTQLIGQNVTGTADGLVVPSTTVSASGTITLTGAAANTTKITLGLPFTPQLQTLPLDLGEPTVQGKRKKITAVTLRVADTLGLQVGTSFANAVTMKDLQLGNLNQPSNTTVTGLFNGDARTIIDQLWQEAGSYCIQQNLPYPATVLGAMPETTVGDSAK